MLGTSPEYDVLIKVSQDHVCRIDVKRNDKVELTLLITAGTVIADRNNRFARRITCTVAGWDPRTGIELTPKSIRDLLAPFGAELWAYAGLRIPVEFELVFLAETAPDWAAGDSFGTAVNGSGYLVMG